MMKKNPTFATIENQRTSEDDEGERKEDKCSG
jgi:hypothetical protein